MFHMCEGTVRLAAGAMDYIRFGTGARTLILLPGLGEALKGIKGTALPMAWLYRLFAKRYTVYMFSRKAPLEAGCTTRSMAQDLKEAMDALGIACADVMGVSMGGMIAQHLAADHPQKVGRLVLAVTAAQSNPTLESSVKEWIACAEKGDHTALMRSNLRLMYSESYCRKNGWMAPVVGRLTKPKSYDRFFLQAQACLKHNAHEALGQIQSPTLVIGGEKDLALGAEASREIASAIPGAKLKMYSEWGHGLYEEAKDFNQVVLNFLQEA